MKLPALAGSNSLRALSWVIQFMLGRELDFEPHFAAEHLPSKFSITFIAEGRQFRYELIVKNKQVIYEALFEKHAVSYRYVFKREWQAKEKTYSFLQKNLGLPKKIANKTKNDASLLDTANQYDIEIAHFIHAYFSRSVRFISRHLHKEDFEKLSKDGSLLKDISEHINKFDLGIANIEIAPIKVGNLEKNSDYLPDYLPIGVHKIAAKEFRLPIFEESDGSQALFFLLMKILPALHHGGLVIVDELDREIHYDMLDHLIDFFVKPEINVGNAQIIFTSHILEPLRYLDKNQIILVEKDQDLSSEAWAINEIKGLRTDENIYSRYLAGAYGALPNLSP